MYAPVFYILQCADDSYYCGSTININVRLTEHQNGTATLYTSKRRPVVLIYTESFTRIADAFEREHQVKRWSRAKKWALIQGDEKLLSRLAQNHHYHRQ